MNIKIIFRILTVFAVSAFMPLFLYFNNSQEAGFIEVFPVLMGFLLVGLIIFGMGYICSKNLDKSCFLASITMLLLSNFASIEKLVYKILPMVKYWHFLIILIFVLIHVFYYTIKKANTEIVKNINKALGIVFCGLIVFNFAFAVPNIIAKMTVRVEETSSDYQNSENDHRNIYYLIFDEFSSTENLKKYCNYDNTNDFIKPLEEMGFTVSQSSFNGSNSSFTYIVTTNYANFDLISDGLSYNDFAYYRENNEMKKLMSNYGYNIVGVGNSQYFGIESLISGSSNKSETIDGSSLQSVILKNTVLYPFVREDKEQVKLILDTFEYFKNAENYKKQSPMFTMSYLAMPHMPYFFNENGGLNNFEDAYNLYNIKGYLGNLKYAQKNIIDITENIIKNDPEAIIILQSDHSYRFAENIEEIDKQKV